MKRIITIILCAMSLGLSAQTNLDTLLFNKVNEYRESKGLIKMKWDNSHYQASNHHSEYLAVLNKDSVKTITGHKEEIDVPNIKELSPKQRFKKFVNKPYTFNGENVCYIAKRSSFSDESFINLIMESWKKSKKHNALMLKPDLKFGACSIIVVNKAFIKQYNGKTYNVPMKKCFATLTFHY